MLKRTKNKEFQVFLGFAIAIVIVPIVFYFAMRSMFDNQMTPAFMVIGLIVMFKAAFVVYVMKDDKNFTKQKTD